MIKRKILSSLTALVCAFAFTVPTAAFAEPAEEYISNGGFESDIWADSTLWNPSADSWDGGNVIASDGNNIHSGSASFHYWFDYATWAHLSQEVALPEGTFDFSGYFHGADSTPHISIYQGEQCVFDEAVTLEGWGNWVNYKKTFKIKEAGTYTLHIDIDCAAGGWGNIDDLSIAAHNDQPAEDPAEEYNKVKIAPVEGLSPDFMRGVDISSAIALENAGVKFYNQAGKEEDIFKILHDSGVNTIRVRIWNDPYDANGNSYGGGANDLETAKIIAKRAAENDMDLYVDFHYSDFWAAPNKQQKPKAWKGLSVSKTAAALGEFTANSLEELSATGANITIVQVGNETSGYFLGSRSWSTMAKYFKAGTKAVREFDPNVKIMIQFGGSRNVSKYDGFCKNLKKQKIDYDIIGASYYPFYASSGTFANLKKNLNNIIKKYGKEVMVVENGYPVTFDDSDGQGNNFSYSDYVDLNKQMPWDISPQGQAQEIRDVIELVSNLNDHKGTGYCYWEPAWITVGDTTNLQGDAWQEQYDKNFELWEKFGCGWASSHSKGYYTVKNYADSNAGGSTWDNIAMFDQDGKAYDSLNVFNYVYTGSDGDSKPYITSFDSPEVVLNASINYTEDEIWRLIWWNQVNCTYSDGTSKWTDIKWISEDGKSIIDAYNNKKLGTYQFHGVLSDFNRTIATMNVTILGDQDYIKTCKLSKTKYTYNGKNRKPTVKVINLKGKTLTKGKSYTVTYPDDCKSIGTHEILVSGMGKYSFTFVLPYEITPKK